MTKIILIVLAIFLGLGITGCKKRTNVATPTTKHKAPVTQQELTKPPVVAYAFGYPEEALAALPTLNLDNMQKRAGSITLSNDGDADLNIQGISPKEGDTNVFTMQNRCPKTLKKGTNCKIYINFVGSDIGTFKQTYLVSTNDPKQPKLLLKAEAIAIEKMTITDFSISNNVKDFLEDKSTTNRDYYARYIFQNHLNNTLKSQIKAELDTVLKSNAYKKNSSTFKSSKTITLYPSVTVQEQGNDQYIFKIAMNGTVATKSTLKNNDQYHDTNITSYDVIKSSDKIFDKEKFSFYLEINAIDQKDTTKMYSEIANILARATVSVLGLEK